MIRNLNTRFAIDNSPSSPKGTVALQWQRAGDSNPVPVKELPRIRRV
jgi:hypothetical protein